MKQTTQKISARRAALESILGCVDGKFSNLEINAAISRYNLSGSEKGLYTALTLGVLERLITVDYYIEAMATRPLSEIDPAVLCAIRLGIYQLAYMDKIPAHSAVDESVKLVSKKSSGFVNAILRSYLRKKNQISLPDKEKEPIRHLSIAYSFPEWMVRLWCDAYGIDTAEKIMADSHERKHTAIRVNTLRTDVKSVLDSLAEKGVSATVSDKFDSMITLPEGAETSVLEGLRDGTYFMQDEASYCAVLALDPKPGDFILDACAAPGTKSFSAAIQMNNEGRIISRDIHASKLSLIKRGAARLNISIMEPTVFDSTKTDPAITAKADRVLCDVPCSGLGVTGKKPDIKLKDADIVTALPPLQYEILCAASDAVKPGGTLVYSTCTLNPGENEEIVSRFLENHRDFETNDFSFASFTSANGMFTCFPHLTGTDGFFIARMRRKL